MSDGAWGFGAAILTVGVSAVGFILQQRQANRVPFLQKQLDVCFEMIDALARLATEPEDIKWEDARKTFWRLYWGTLSIVEDTAIERLMVQIGKIVPSSPGKTPELPRPDFEGLSYRLAHAARDLMERSWKTPLPALAGRRQQ